MTPRAKRYFRRKKWNALIGYKVYDVKRTKKGYIVTVVPSNTDIKIELEDFNIQTRLNRLFFKGAFYDTNINS